MKRTLALVATAVSVLTANSEVVHADYLACCGTNPVRWNTNVVSMNWCTASFTAGSMWVQSIEHAAVNWSIPTDSAQVISVGSDSNCAMNNTQNETWYNGGANPDGALQAEYNWSSNNGNCNGCTAPTIVESDIVTYALDENGHPNPWSLDFPQGSTHPPVSTLAYPIVTYQHEMGHTLGFIHANSGMVRMGPSIPCGGWFHTGATTVQPLTTERLDAALLYPASGSSFLPYMANTQTDLGDASSKQLSYDPSSDSTNFYPRNATPIVGQQANRVRVGHTLRARVCQGNLGSTAGSDGGVKIYRSLNRTFDGAATDPVIATYLASTFSAFQKSCFTASFVIPAGTPNGTYFLLAGSGGSTSGRTFVAQDRSFVVIP